MGATQHGRPLGEEGRRAAVCSNSTHTNPITESNVLWSFVRGLISLLSPRLRRGIEYTDVYS